MNALVEADNWQLMQVSFGDGSVAAQRLREVLLLPVPIDPARQRAILTPVFGALLDTIRLTGGTAQGLKAHRTDAHAGTQRQGKPADIGEFKCDATIPTGIDGMGSDVDH